MTIETKYNIGDEVWFMNEGEPIFVVGGLFSYELALEDALKYALKNLLN